MTKGFTDISVRFFVCELALDEPDITEVDEQTFIEADGRITYERHTIHANGVKQICLTKGL